VPQPGDWHHVAGTYDGKSMRLYVDGLMVAMIPPPEIPVTPDALYIAPKARTPPKATTSRATWTRSPSGIMPLSKRALNKLAKAGSEK